MEGNPSCVSVGGTQRVVNAAGGRGRRGLILENGHTCLTHAHWCGTADQKKKSGGGVEGCGGGSVAWRNHMLHHNLKLLKVTHSLALCSLLVLTPLRFSARRLLMSGLIGPKTPSPPFTTHTPSLFFSSSFIFFFFEWRSGTDCDAVCQALANVLFSLHQGHRHTPTQTHTHT